MRQSPTDGAFPCGLIGLAPGWRPLKRAVVFRPERTKPEASCGHRARERLPQASQGGWGKSSGVGSPERGRTKATTLILGSGFWRVSPCNGEGAVAPWRIGFNP
jgi:hypothetical protein